MSILAAVIGSPVSQSLSPAIHGASFGALGVDWSYSAVHCTLEDLPEFVARVRGGGFGGFSVTMPLKEAVLDHLDVVDDDAALLRAVNCVTVLADGRLRGSNTDGAGCRDALLEQGGLALPGAKICLLGAGGTARAVALALVTAGSTVVIVNRTRASADQLLDMVGRSGSVTGSAAVGSAVDAEACDVIVNATSVGMGSDESPLPAALFHEGQCVLDAVYSPLRTRLLRDADRAGARTVDGLWMLIHQARHQQIHWFGTAADSHFMRAESERELARRAK